VCVLKYEPQEWEEQFTTRVKNHSNVVDMMFAAHFLNIPKLLKLISQTVANMIKGKTPAEIRENFGLRNDFTREEEENMKSVNTVRSNENHSHAQHTCMYSTHACTAHMHNMILSIIAHAQWSFEEYPTRI